MKHNIYPLSDTPTAAETNGASFKERFHSQSLMAVPTGEFRQPNKGEWYLSGAIVAAYKAPNALNTPFHIAKLVKVEKTVTEHFKIIDLT